MFILSLLIVSYRLEAAQIIYLKEMGKLLVTSFSTDQILWHLPISRFTFYLVFPHQYAFMH